MVMRLGVDMVKQGWRCGDNIFQCRILAIENTQGIGMQASLFFVAERVHVPRKIFDQLGAMTGARFTVTQGIELQLDITQAQLAPQPRRQNNLLGFHIRAGKSQGLEPELMELTIASTLRLFVAEHRAGIPQALRAVVQQIVFQHRANGRCRAFGPQGQAFAVQAVDKGIHFLFDNIGHFAQRTHE